MITPNITGLLWRLQEGVKECHFPCSTEPCRHSGSESPQGSGLGFLFFFKSFVVVAVDHFLLQYCFCFMFWLFGDGARGILAL